MLKILLDVAINYIYPYAHKLCMDKNFHDRILDYHFIILVSFLFLKSFLSIYDEYKTASFFILILILILLRSADAATDEKASDQSHSEREREASPAFGRFSSRVSNHTELSNSKALIVMEMLFLPLDIPPSPPPLRARARARAFSIRKFLLPRRKSLAAYYTYIGIYIIHTHA